ncbi:hypothetical protein D3C86_2024140 [compost metagenome]
MVLSSAEAMPISNDLSPLQISAVTFTPMMISTSWMMLSAVPSLMLRAILALISLRYRSLFSGASTASPSPI